MPLYHAELLSLNYDDFLPLLLAGKREVERGIHFRRLAGLEDVRHSFQKNLDGGLLIAITFEMAFISGFGLFNQCDFFLSTFGQLMNVVFAIASLVISGWLF